jgi:hypothetical protein
VDFCTLKEKELTKISSEGSVDQQRLYDDDDDDDDIFRAVVIASSELVCWQN